MGSTYYEDPFEVSPSQIQNVEDPTSIPRIEDESDFESPLRWTRLLGEIYKTYELGLFLGEPQSFEEASKEKCWTKVMNEEMPIIEKNKT